MKNTMLLALVVSLHLAMSVAHTQEIEWVCDYDEAKKEAYLKGEFLLINFVENWDPAKSPADDPRTRMENEIWKDTTVASLTGQYVTVRLQCTNKIQGYIPGERLGEMDRYVQLIRIHKILELPTTIICDPYGTEFARIVGLTSVEDVSRILRVRLPNLFHPYEALRRLESAPEDVGLNVAVGDAYFDAGIAGMSKQYYERVMEADTIDRDAVLREHVAFNQAVNQYRMNMKSLAPMEHLLEEYPESEKRPVYLYWLVRLHGETGDEPGAKKYYRVLEEEFPDREETRLAAELIPD